MRSGRGVTPLPPCAREGKEQPRRGERLTPAPCYMKASPLPHRIAPSPLPPFASRKPPLSLRYGQRTCSGQRVRACARMRACVCSPSRGGGIMGMRVSRHHFLPSTLPAVSISRRHRRTIGVCSCSEDSTETGTGSCPEDPTVHDDQ
jgi:hypothetical protein